MRLAHKRNVQAKLQKRIKAIVANLAQAPKTAKPVTAKPVVEKKAAIKPVAEKVAAATKVDVALTPKQQQVLDIVAGNAEASILSRLVWPQVRKMRKPLLGLRVL